MKNHATICAIALVTGVSMSASAATINVPSQQANIQAAINAAVNGDLIVVAPGSYSQKIDFLGKMITVRSSGGASQTTITAAGLSGSVVTCQNGEGPDTILDGFTITGGIGTPSGGIRQGGGLYLVASDPTIINCIIRNNTANEGGAVYSFASDPRIINCIARLNTGGNGGAFYNWLSNPIIINSTMASNTGATGTVMFSAESNARLINCIVWGNGLAAWQVGLNPPIVTYSNIEGGYAGAGNINANPLFVSQATGDLRLSAGSPAIDAGDSLAIAARTAVDLAGGARGVNDPGAIDTGIALFGLIADLGAYEVQVNPQPACPADIAPVPGDGVVDIADLLAVIQRWGVCP